LLTESWLLALAGSMAGLLVAFWSVPALLALAPAGLPRIEEVRLDYQTVLFAVGTSLLTSLLFGIAPALRATRLDVNEAVKASSLRSSAGRMDARVRGLLIVSEVALSLVLLIGAALLIRSFLKLRAVETGFDPAQVVTAQASLTSEQYQTVAQVWAFEQQVLARLSALPGVTAAATASNVPLERGLRAGMRFEGASGPVEQTVQIRAISPAYFRALGIPMLRGRDFSQTDIPSSMPVIIINDHLARRYWPDRDPLGASIPWQGARRQIVGVVGDLREIGLDRDVEPTVYVPVPQMPEGLAMAMNRWFLTSWIVRTAGPVDLAAALRQAVKEIDPQMPLTNVRPLTQVISASLASRQFILVMMGVFASLALVLTAVGLYGVLSYQVSQRTNEIGIRMALGAQPRDVLRLVVGQGMGLVIIGMAIGLAAAFWVSRLLTGMLFDVTPTDPATFAGVSSFLVVIALLASYLPARRAMRVDPMAALRYE
jgi:predicted permease